MNRSRLFGTILAFVLLAPVRAAETPLPVAEPAKVGVSAERLAKIDDAVRKGIDRGDCPGAVVLVVHKGAVVWRKAYGDRARQPAVVPMTTDTVFDLASLTKPVATASSVMLLIERGKLHLTDHVADHIPAFGAKGKDKVTVENLLLHTSGLIADNAEADYRDGRDKALERLYALTPQAAPGERFTYSDLGFIVLGQLVEKVSGTSLDAFAKKNVFDPLGMNETGFRPGEKLKERAAPSAKRDGKWLVGEVHDPRSAALGGVAGHAGLFSTADDLAVFAQMLLDGGSYNGKRVFKEETVKLMTAPRKVPGGLRAYGWDVATSYSANRGKGFTSGEGFGHTGFTGTSIWVDPPSRTAVIFLSSRLHPDGKGNVTRLRGEVATLAAEAPEK
jgi:CubicO group peptidase (beta-lactamase class C family)